MLSFEISDETQKIYDVLKDVPFGASMTFAQLSLIVGFTVTSNNSNYRSALDKVLKDHSLSICSDVRNVSFRCRTVEEGAAAKHRDRRVRGQAKRALFEARPGLMSNDKAVQAKASVTAAKYALILSMKAASNRDMPSDRI